MKRAIIIAILIAFNCALFAQIMPHQIVNTGGADSNVVMISDTRPASFDYGTFRVVGKDTFRTWLGVQLGACTGLPYHYRLGVGVPTIDGEFRFNSSPAIASATQFRIDKTDEHGIDRSGILSMYGAKDQIVLWSCDNVGEYIQFYVVNNVDMGVYYDMEIIDIVVNGTPSDWENFGLSSFGGGGSAPIIAADDKGLFTDHDGDTLVTQNVYMRTIGLILDHQTTGGSTFGAFVVRGAGLTSVINQMQLQGSITWRKALTDKTAYQTVNSQTAGVFKWGFAGGGTDYALSLYAKGVGVNPDVQMHGYPNTRDDGALTSLLGSQDGTGMVGAYPIQTLYDSLGAQGGGGLFNINNNDGTILVDSIVAQDVGLSIETLGSLIMGTGHLITGDKTNAQRSIFMGVGFDINFDEFIGIKQTAMFGFNHEVWTDGSLTNFNMNIVSGRDHDIDLRVSNSGNNAIFCQQHEVANMNNTLVTGWDHYIQNARRGVVIGGFSHSLTSLLGAGNSLIGGSDNEINSTVASNYNSILGSQNSTISESGNSFIVASSASNITLCDNVSIISSSFSRPPDNVGGTVLIGGSNLDPTIAKSNMVYAYNLSIWNAPDTSNSISHIAVIDSSDEGEIKVMPLISTDAGNDITQGTDGGINYNSYESKALTLESPTNAEDITMWYADEAITIKQVNDVVVGSATPSLTYNIEFATTRNGASTSLWVADRVTTSEAGAETTTFTDATIPAGNWIWFETSAQSGTVDHFNFSVKYEKD